MSEELSLNLARTLNALEKQRSKKVTHISENDREYEDWVCPACRTILQQRRKGASRVTIYKYKFCHWCGQKLDWSDTD